MTDERKICVTVGMKVNLGNFESADASVCLSGIPVDAENSEIEEMLDTAKAVFSKVKMRLLEICEELREAGNARPVAGGRYGGY